MDLGIVFIGFVGLILTFALAPSQEELERRNKRRPKRRNYRS